MSKEVKVFNNGNINIRLSKDTMKRICTWRAKYGDDKAYEDAMWHAQEDIRESMEDADIYEYGMSQLCCMTWSTCDYHDLYYCYGTDMIYDIPHYDIWHTLCEGRTLKIAGKKVDNEDDRKDITRWILDEHGYDESDYEDFGVGYDDEYESEAI